MGNEVPIIFPDFIPHDYFGVDENVISAGYCEVTWDYLDNDGERPCIKYKAFGKSTSLKLKSRPEDAKIIQHAFEFKV